MAMSHTKFPAHRWNDAPMPSAAWISEFEFALEDDMRCFDSFLGFAGADDIWVFTDVDIPSSG